MSLVSLSHLNWLYIEKVDSRASWMVPIFRVHPVNTLWQGKG